MLLNILKIIAIFLMGVLGVSLILPMSIVAQEFSFIQSQEIITGGGAFFSIAGDFNEDGFLDLAVANSGAHTISILLNNQSGLLGNPNSFPVGTEPRSLVSGDFNEDGHLDLAVANWLSHNISILIGNGEGSFSGPNNLPINIDMPFPSSITSGDFNNDEHLDLMVGNWRDNSISLFLGEGNGNFLLPSINFEFGTEVVIEIPGGEIVYIGISAIGASDFNKDGNLDIAAVHNKDAKIFILFGDGNGSFSSIKSFSIGYDSRSLVVTDINKDGNRDLIAGGVFVLVGDGKGNFLLKSTFIIGALQTSMVAADFNRDGNLDLAVPHFFNRTVEIVAGDGTGQFVGPIFSMPVGERPRGATALDLNNDGLADLVVANQFSNSISVFLNTSSPIISIEIDIKPNSFPNCINLDSQGSVPVAILGNEILDVREIEIKSLKFADTPVIIKKNGKPQASFEDINNDGKIDLVVHFQTRLLKLIGTEKSVELNGNLKTGELIQGSDIICFVGRSD